jgi:hypothetical protein
MPFLPFVLLLVWQAVGRSASFALGWATALYFGQVPGKQGRVLAVVSLMAAGWVLLLVGFGAPLLIGTLSDWAGLVPRNFDMSQSVVAGLLAALVLTPPAIAALTIWVEFHQERSLRQWLRTVAPSYPAAASLGIGVLQMVVFTPFLVVQRIRNKRSLVQVAVSMRDDTNDEALTEAVAGALNSLGIEKLSVRKAEGFLTWPMRTVGYAVKHLLGEVVRGEPMYLAAGELELYAYATNVAIRGRSAKVHRARAALEREMPFRGAYLTWSEDSQAFEDAIMGAARSNGGPRLLRHRLDEVQDRIDAASLNVDEWNVLYRLRLQVEHRGEAGAASRGTQREPAEQASA